MRLISSDNTVDIDYESATLVVESENIFAIKENRKYALYNGKDEKDAIEKLKAVRKAKGMGRCFHKIGE